MTPAGSGTLALVLDVEPKWHVYWRNAGDSGLPVGVKWTTPKGVSVGDPRWPVPRRYVTGGTVLDYVLEGRVVLLFPLSVSADVAAGTLLDIRGKVDWLVCKDVCLPGSGEVALRLRVGGESQADERGAGVVLAAAEALPRPASEAKAVGLNVRWEGLNLVIEADGAAEMRFFPFESDDLVLPDDAISTGETRGSKLVLPYPESARGAVSVGGVVEFRRASGEVVRAEIHAGPAPRS
ncbi:MAG: hypothetical protein IBJ11_01365 [Phycisphaerales bacterium]|nr:hypothetical protein [Phycisphaerales bacterium]